MNRVPVSSSDLRSVGYDETTKLLEIEFHGGRIYQYYGVPRAVYEGLMQAASHGKYFHTHVKNAYPYQRVS
jgi:hypothetical protein